MELKVNHLDKFLLVIMKLDPVCSHTMNDIGIKSILRSISNTALQKMQIFHDHLHIHINCLYQNNNHFQ